MKDKQGKPELKDTMGNQAANIENDYFLTTDQPIDEYITHLEENGQDLIKGYAIKKARK